MKASIFLIVGCVLCEGKLSVPSEAILSIIMQDFAKESLSFDLIFFESGINVVKEIVGRIPSTHSLKVINGSRNFPTKHLKFFQLSAPTILIFGSLQDFSAKLPKIKWRSNLESHRKHILYVPDLTQDDAFKLFSNGFSIDRVAFLMNKTESSIDAVSCFMYTTTACKQKQFVTVNQFFGSNSSWKETVLYPSKYRNFHNCSLSSVNSFVGEASPTSVMPVIGKYFNFTVVDERHQTKRTKNEGIKQKTQTSSILEEIIGITLYDQATGKAAFLVSTPLKFSAVHILHHPGKPYTQLEKMFLMFNTDVWIGIASFFAFWWTSILIIKRTPQSVQDFIFDSGVDTPMMNSADIFLNGAQNNVPSRNFARFLLILFITWSLIIRTCYQSMLFTYLQKDLRRPKMTSIYDLVSTESNAFEIFNDLENSFNCHRDNFSCLDRAADPANKAGFLGGDKTLEHIHRWKYRSGLSSLHYLEETIAGYFWGVLFQESSPFFEDFNDKIGQMVSSGLFNDWTFENYTKRQIHADDIGPEVLTMDHLEVAFIACALPLVLAIAAFLAELAIHGVKKTIPRLTIYFSVKEFYKLQPRRNAVPVGAQIVRTLKRRDTSTSLRIVSPKIS